MEGFEKPVAIKRILPHLTDQQDLMEAFIEEAKLAARLQHPNIVQIYDFGSLLYEMLVGQRMFTGDPLHTLLRVREADFVASEKAAFCRGSKAFSEGAKTLVRL